MTMKISFKSCLAEHRGSVAAAVPVAVDPAALHPPLLLPHQTDQTDPSLLGRCPEQYSTAADEIW